MALDLVQRFTTRTSTEDLLPWIKMASVMGGVCALGLCWTASIASNLWVCQESKTSGVEAASSEASEFQGVARKHINSVDGTVKVYMNQFFHRIYKRVLPNFSGKYRLENSGCRLAVVAHASCKSSPWKDARIPDPTRFHWLQCALGSTGAKNGPRSPFWLHAHSISCRFHHGEPYQTNYHKKFP
jgi:hypothetical protein